MAMGLGLKPSPKTGAVKSRIFLNLKSLTVL